MAKTNTPRIAILGAGPVGLEAALYAVSLQLPVTVYERGRVGEYLHWWGHVRLFSPFGMNTTSLGRAAIKKAKPDHDLPGDDACITGREHLTAYLNPLAQSEVLKGVIQTESRVVSVGRRGFLKGDEDPRRGQQPFRILIRDKQNKERCEEADVVIDCTGTHGQHRWMGDGGIPALGEMPAESNIVYGLEDILGDRKSHYAGKNTLVIGAGYSAATTVANLATLAEDNNATWVIWLSRGSGTQPIKRLANDPLKERDRLAVRANSLATRGDANVEHHGQASIHTVEFHGDRGFKISGRIAGKETTWEVERLIANVGYTPNTDLYRELQVQECYASLGPMKLAAALTGGDCLKQTTHGADTLRNPEPNFYILGAKSYGRNANFLLRLGFEQVREVFTLIAGQPKLNLYQKQ